MLIAGVAIRAVPLLYQTFYEPDVFFHYAVVLQAVSNNYRIPLHFSLSGNALIAEPHGLYYLALVPYYFLHYFIGLYELVRILPLAYFALLFLIFYYFAGFFSKKREFLALAMLVFVLLPANLIRTIATEWRGDGFISMFILLSLALMLKGYQEESIPYILASAAALSIANAVWNGGMFAYAVYSLSVLALIGHNFAKANARKLKYTAIMSLALFLYILLVLAYNAAGIIVVQADMLAYAASAAVLCLLALAAYHLSRRRLGERKRIYLICALIVILSFAALLFGMLYNWTGFYLYFQNYGGYPNAYRTIEELQPPSAIYVGTYDSVLSLFVPAFWPLFISTMLPLSMKYLVFLMLGVVFAVYYRSSIGENRRSRFLCSWYISAWPASLTHSLCARTYCWPYLPRL